MERRSFKHGATVVAEALFAVTAALAAAQASGAAGNTYQRCPAWVASAPGKTTASVSYPAGGIVVGPTRAMVTAHVATASARAVVVQYGRGGSYLACSGVEQSGTDLLVKGLLPDTTYRYRVVVQTRAGVVFGGGRTFHTLPPGHVPQGVKVGSVAIGGMSADEARAALARPLAGMLRLSYAGAYLKVSRAKVGARLELRPTLTAALTASPGTLLPALKVAVDPAGVNAFVASLGKRWSRTGTAAGVRLAGSHAVITPVQQTVAIQTRKMVSLITRQLTTGSQGAIPLAVVRKPPPKSGTLAQKAVVVRIGSQTLTAYLNGRAIRETPITTGRPALPTPIGSYFVHYRASPYTFTSPWPPGSAYYYPPTTVTWAMYFFDNDFLHNDPGEPEDAYGAGSNLGPYASHGCVHVPYSVMSWLYNWLPVGATVIVSQT